MIQNVRGGKASKQATLATQFLEKERARERKIVAGCWSKWVNLIVFFLFEQFENENIIVDYHLWKQDS